MKIYVRRFLMLFVAALIVFMTGVSAAQAASPHFKKNGEPVCTISYPAAATASTTCHTVLAGLGNDDLLATVTVRGFAVYQCENNGGQQAPGQNKVVEGPVTAPTFIDSDAIKNGNLTLDTKAAVLAAKDTVTATEAGCPNNNWTGVDPVLTVTRIDLVIEQPLGTVIFRCSAFNKDGLTSPVTLTC